MTSNSNDFIITLIGLAIFLIISSIILVPVYTAMGKYRSSSDLGNSSGNSGGPSSIGSSDTDSSNPGGGDNSNSKGSDSGLSDSGNGNSGRSRHNGNSEHNGGPVVEAKPPNDQSSSTQSSNFPGLSNLANPDHKDENNSEDVVRSNKSNS